MESTTTLAADPASVGVARRFVVEALTAAGRAADADTAELLVSELVTNAVLHARSRVELVVQIQSKSVRVEVRDTNRALPSTRIHDKESQTGRGLELVELLSARWGAELAAGEATGGPGKSVWFELESAHPSPPVSAISPQASLDARGEAGGPLFPVCLEGIPLALYRASQEHSNGLIREFVLITLSDTDTDTVPARLVALSEELTDRFGGESASVLAQVIEAEERGDNMIDLLLKLPTGATIMFEGIVELLEEADRYCADGALLTLEAPEEVRRFRRWCVKEIGAQLGGEVPNRWRDR